MRVQRLSTEMVRAWREKRTARGLCYDCPNLVNDDRFRHCRACRIARSERERLLRSQRKQAAA